MYITLSTFSAFYGYCYLSRPCPPISLAHDGSNVSLVDKVMFTFWKRVF